MFEILIERSEGSENSSRGIYVRKNELMGVSVFNKYVLLSCMKLVADRCRLNKSAQH